MLRGCYAKVLQDLDGTRLWARVLTMSQTGEFSGQACVSPEILVTKDFAGELRLGCQSHGRLALEVVPDAGLGERGCIVGAQLFTSISPFSSILFGVRIPANKAPAKRFLARTSRKQHRTNHGVPIAFSRKGPCEHVDSLCAGAS